VFLLPRHADRRAPRTARRSPGTGDPAAGGRSCGRSGGRRRGWRPAGRSSTPCTHPTAPHGTRRDALAARRRDARLRHGGCRRLLWKPGANSTLKAAALLPAGARVEFVLLVHAVPGHRPSRAVGAGGSVCRGVAAAGSWSSRNLGEKKRES